LHMRILFTSVLILMLSLVAFSWAHAVPLWIPLGSSLQEEARISLLESSESRMVVEFQLDGYLLDEVEIEGIAHAVIGVPGMTTLMEKGLPDLPKLRERLIVPDDAHMALRILEADELVVETLPIVPSKGHLPRTIDPQTVPYEFDDFYQSDSWYPMQNSELSEPFILRDFRGISLQINPVQYNPATGQLRVYRRLVLEVFSDGPGHVNLKRRTKSLARLESDFQSIYRRLFLNYSAAKYTSIAEPGRMLIVCYKEFYPNIEPLYHWKLQKGVPTKVALYPDSTGSGASALFSYIQDEYDSPEGLTYILLVGDVGQIPTNSGTAEGAPSDPCYVKLEGGDHYPDAFISRLSATSSAQVDNQVEKFINYEASPDTGATAAAWYHQGCGIASDETGGTGMTDWERMELLRADLLAYTYTHVDTIYDPGATASQVTTAVNDGRSIINYIGHGSGTSWGTTDFSVSHVNALSNGHMLPYICDVACLNGNFTMGGDCFAEAWLKAGSPGSPKGGIAHYAASTLADWVPPCVMQAEVIGLLVAEERNTFGGLCFNGVMKGMDAYPGYYGTKLMEQYNLFGDCSVVMRTDLPATMVVSHDPVIFVDATSYDVQVPGMEGALASLYHAGVFYGSAYTNASGNATILLVEEFPGPGQVTLTVTAYNRVPYITTLDVVTPFGPFMVYDSHLIDDVAGNGDGLVNPGESIGMAVALRNGGSDLATGVSAVLKLVDPYVQISDSLESYGDVPAGSTATSSDDYDFQVSGACPDGYILSFTLEINAAETSWVDHSPNIIVTAPELVYEDHVIDDSGGNDNGQPDSGETFDMTISLKNWGSGTAAGVAAQLTTGDPYLDVDVATADYGDILSGQVASSQTDYTLTADVGCPSGHVATVVLNISADGPYAASDTLQLLIGQRPILLVDDDDGGGYQSYWINALNANGYPFDVWELASRGSPPSDSLTQYRVVLWTTADDYGAAGSPTSLTATDQANLQVYLDAGGNLFLSSQDLLYDNNPVTDFITNYLHVANHTDDTHPTQVIGFAGDPISEDMDLSLSYPFSNWADDIVVGAGATCVFENAAYSRDEFLREEVSLELPLTRENDQRQGACGGLRYPDVGSSIYKVVFFAFPFEAISSSAPDPNNQKTVLANIIDWFLGDAIPPSVVANFRSTLMKDHLALDWSPATDNKGVDYYVIYRHTTPDFVSTGAESIGFTVDTSFVDMSTAVGDTLVNHYYCVKAVDGSGNKSACSPHIGEFDRLLTTIPSASKRNSPSMGSLHNEGR